MASEDIRFLEVLETVIRTRLAEQPESSYTARLAAEGDRRVAQKVGEEAVELALATVGGSRDEQLEEAADLIYHLLLALAVKGISLSDVVAVLEARHTA